MAYLVKEIFYSLQGEGVNSGRPAVFVRFSGCNLWSGRKDDRTGIPCPFCDTDFVGTDGPGGGRYNNATDVAAAMAQRLPCPPKAGRRSFVVITGGEPALQIDMALIDELRSRNWEIAIETNGTLPIPDGMDWITVSPKVGAPIVITSGDELKLLHPQNGLDPAAFETLNFSHFILQPVDNQFLDENTRLCLDYCLTHPPWRLGLQMHKVLGIR